MIDPKKRDELISEYMMAKERIHNNDISQRLGSLAHQDTLKTTFQPIVEASKESSDAITKELKPIKREIENLNNQLLQTEIKRKRSVAEKLVDGDTGKNALDQYFSIFKSEDGDYFLGKEKIKIDKDHNIHVGDKVYAGTNGLWNIIMQRVPKDYTDEDRENYLQLALQTELPKWPRDVRYNSQIGRTTKYKEFLKQVEDVMIENKKPEVKGDGIFLPGTIKGLLQKLNILVAEFQAGNKTTQNEIVAVLDELKRRKAINEIIYNQINTTLQ